MKNLFIRYGRKPNEAMIETLRFTAIILLSIGLVMYNPIFQLTFFLVPALYTALTYRNGILFSILSFVISVFAMIFVSGNSSLLFIFGLMATMGIIVGETNYRKNNMMLSIIMGSMVIIINFVAMIYIQNKVSGIDFIEYMINTYFALLEEGGMTDMISMNLSELKSAVRITIPALIMSMGISIGVLNYFVAGNLVNKMNQNSDGFRNFWEFTLPGSALMGILVSMVGIGLAELLTGYSTEIIFSNIKILYATLFFIQGLAVIDFITLRKLKPILRTLIFVVLIFTVFFYPFLATMGALDLVFNIRRIEK